jgi:hypothetical protein
MKLVTTKRKESEMFGSDAFEPLPSYVRDILNQIEYCHSLIECVQGRLTLVERRIEALETINLERSNTMGILNIDLSDDAVPPARLLDDKSEALARLESAGYGLSQRSGREMYALFFSFPEEPNVEGVSHYVTLPTEDEMNSREAIVVTKRNRMLRGLKEFYEKFDIAYEGGVDTDEVCEILSREKPEVRVVVGKQTDRKNEDTGEEYPDANNIRRFL